MTGCLTNLFGVDAPSGPKVDWGAGKKRQKKQMGIEPSDSDGIGGMIVRYLYYFECRVIE